MNLAKLRIDISLGDAILEQLFSVLNLDIDLSRIKGEMACWESSVFNLTIAETDTPRKLTEAIIDFSNQCISKNINLSSPNISTVLEIGIAYSEQFFSSVSFSPSELQLISSLGLTLSIRLYPTLDEISENENA